MRDPMNARRANQHLGVARALGQIGLVLSQSRKPLPFLRVTIAENEAPLETALPGQPHQKTKPDAGTQARQMGDVCGPLDRLDQLIDRLKREP